ncbi:hypothetical protein C8J56DRAFT_1006033 [Mycena floridula]|nr:hypothetical protein C8J56DRAFT_1006033 [Mycena floridula]
MQFITASFLVLSAAFIASANPLIDPKLGLFVPLPAKTEKSQAIADFLLSGFQIVVATEPLTLQWFAMKFEDSDTYAILDTAANETGRQAHLNGAVAQALIAQAPDLLSSPLVINSVNILASKVKPIPGATGVTSGLVNGLRIFVQAQPHKVDAVRDFLIVSLRALPLVEAEPGTAVWYAIEFPGTGMFGIIDFFPSDAARDAHLAGKVATALFASVDELFTGPPDVVKVSVLAAKVC